MPTILTLAILGLILVVAEMFLPGLILGLIGAGLLITAIVMGYTEFGPFEGTLIAAVIGTLTIVLFILWMKYFQKTSVGRGMMLDTALGPNASRSTHFGLIGKTGVAVTDLRPSGRASFDDIRHDVVADGAFIAKGDAVSVVLVEGNRIVVRKNA